MVVDILIMFWSFKTLILTNIESWCWELEAAGLSLGAKESSMK